MIESQKPSSHLRDKIVDLIDRNIVFIKATILFVMVAIGIFIYTYDRSFCVHQHTISTVERFNNREGLFCSKVHVGHDGTTLHFEPIPKEIGTAGPIDPTLMFAGDPTQPLYLSPLFWLIIVAVLLMVLIMILVASYYKKRRYKEEGHNA